MSRGRDRFLRDDEENLGEAYYTVSEEEAGQRLDLYLAGKEPLGPSRAYVQRLIESGRVHVNGRRARAAYRVRPEDEIWVVIPEPESPETLQPEEISLDILYEDPHIIVINKGRNMPVHPGVGFATGTLVNALLAHSSDLSGIAGVMRPGIVHRLDKDTTGVLVVAKTNEAHLGITRQIKERTVNRRYLALIRGQPGADEGLIEAPIGRHPVDRLRMAVVPRGGREAITHFWVLERYGDYSLVEVKLETGRTHQIRVHMAHIGHPIAGDPVYGGRGGGRGELGLEGQALHARLLGFVHPVLGQYMEFEAPPPEDMVKAIETLRRRAKGGRAAEEGPGGGGAFDL